MADYQYVAAGRNVSLVAEERVGPFGAEEEPMLLVPPTFSPHDHPLDYAFRNSRTTDSPAQGESQQAADGLHTAPGMRLVLDSGAGSHKAGFSFHIERSVPFTALDECPS